MDPYGGPHHQRVARGAGALPARRSGSPTRASPWSWPTAAAPRAAGRPGSGRSATTSRRRCSTTRSTRCTPWPSAARRPRPDPGRHPRLVLRRLPRRAGRAAPPRRVPRGRRRAPRSPTGGSTTPPTPSATSATRTRTRSAYDASSACWPTRRACAARCCSSTAWPTTTWWRRTPCGCRRRCSRPGRPHEVLPLSGVTHMTPQEVVAENLLLLAGRLPPHAPCTPSLDLPSGHWSCRWPLSW